MTITDDRDEQTDFTNSYYEFDQAVLIRKDDIDTTEFADLEGRLAGAQSRTTGEATVEEELVSPGLIDGDAARSYGNYVFAVNDLESGNVDAVVVDNPVARTFAADRPVRVAFVFETGGRFGLGLPKGDDRVTFLEAGAIVERGPPDQLFTDLRSDRTAEFLSRLTGEY